MSCGIHLMTISQEMLKISILDMSLKITSWGINVDLPGANELKGSGLSYLWYPDLVFQTEYTPAWLFILHGHGS